MLHDAHCHLTFMENGEDVAADARASGTLLFTNTVTPRDWEQASELFAPFENVSVGFGMHPWWVANDFTLEKPSATEPGPLAQEGDVKNERRYASQRAEHNRIAEEAEHANNAFTPKAIERRAEVIQALHDHDPRFVGEIGLDFGWRHVATKHEQLAMFADIARWCSQQKGKVLSLHSIKAARETADVLEQTGALRSCTCVYHWFSGSSDLLKRAIDAGCFFSCGQRMLATGKGREYAKAIPADRLLLETDAPPERGTRYSYAEMEASLKACAEAIIALKGEHALQTMTTTYERLFSS